MKKMLFAAFAGICVISSIRATSAGTGRISNSQQVSQVVRDTIPGKKSDTSRTPKRDTTSMPKVIDQLGK